MRKTGAIIGATVTCALAFGIVPSMTFATGTHKLTDDSYVDTSESGYVYTGKAIKPRVRVVYNGWSDEKPSKTLKANVDYTYVWQKGVKGHSGKYKTIKGSPKGIGYYRVLVKGKGKYRGAIASNNVTIGPKSPEKITAKGGKKTLTIKWKKQKNVDGYYLCVRGPYHESWDPIMAKLGKDGVGKVTGGNTTSYTFKHLKYKGTYQVSVLSYKDYKGWKGVATQSSKVWDLKKGKYVKEDSVASGYYGPNEVYVKVK